MKTHGTVKLNGQVIGYVELEKDGWFGYDAHRQRLPNQTPLSKYYAGQFVLRVCAGVDTPTPPAAQPAHSPKAHAAKGHKCLLCGSRQADECYCRQYICAKCQPEHICLEPRPERNGLKPKDSQSTRNPYSTFTPHTAADVQAMMLGVVGLGIDPLAVVARVPRTPGGRFTPVALWAHLYGAVLHQVGGLAAEREFYEHTITAQGQTRPDLSAWIAQNVNA